MLSPGSFPKTAYPTLLLLLLLVLLFYYYYYFFFKSIILCRINIMGY